MAYITKNQRQQLLQKMLDELDRRENTFPIIDKIDNFQIPILNKSGIVKGWEKYDTPPKNFKGLVLEINDHGNVTVWRYFKNGNRREVASRV